MSVKASPNPGNIALEAFPPISNHLPSLDGIRALSILLVLFDHGALLFGFKNELLAKYYGHLGVSIFFVISGLLITWLMIREFESIGALSLRNFYIRRALRILPVFWLLLLSVTILRATHVISIRWMDILRALTFTHNYPLSLGKGDGYAQWLGHTWSLSMEEQFYLIWPSVFVFFKRRRLLQIAAFISFSRPLLILLNYVLFPSLRGQEAHMFHTQADILMIGCLSAFLLDLPEWRKKLSQLSPTPILAITSIYLFVVQPFLLAHNNRHSVMSIIIALVLPTFEVVSIAVSLQILIAGRRTILYKILNHRVATHIGKLSYSIYIWQQLFLGRVASQIISVVGLVFRFSLIYCVSLFSFYVIEKPFNRLRSHFRAVPS
jgi:peptidoglycan/LPS O-acetylase OafA/YrhL